MRADCQSCLGKIYDALSQLEKMCEKKIEDAIERGRDDIVDEEGRHIDAIIYVRNYLSSISPAIVCRNQE